MSADTIRRTLGNLQDDPDNAESWSELRAALGVGEARDSADISAAGMSVDDLARLLERARKAHATRREHEAVAALLEIESLVLKGTPREADLVAELARVLDEDVLDDERGLAAYERLLALRPGDAKAEEAIETSQAKRAKWSDVVAKYVEEAKKAEQGSFKSSLLVTAAEVAYRHGRPQLSKGKKKKRDLPELMEQVVGGLREALAIDPKNPRAAHVLEHVLRAEERWDELATLMEQQAESAAAKDDRVLGLLRLARMLQRKAKATERAQAVYEKVLDLAPQNPDATSALVDLFTANEMWEHLVALYDGQLAAGTTENQAGTIVQIAMVHWKMRGRPEAAEPYFERLRKLEPAHPGMLAFFREVCAQRGESARLMSLLNDAQRAMPEGAERQSVALEIAKLSEESASASKAIENWRNLLRQDPANVEARDALKRLYRQTGGWNALTDLLRQELERIPASDADGRLGVLREIAAVYKDSIKSDSALVTVLSQIVAIRPDDMAAIRELARVYDALGRWRDLLTTQARLAELETQPGAKAELYRAVARRWLDQFSNVQNALEAYEKLAELAPADEEATSRLKELYAKRRAYKPLYDLLEKQAERMPEGPARRELWTEMAKIAAERLDRGADAVALYRKVLAEDPAAAGALDALEKQAERDKDFKTVAEVLERRTNAASDDATKLALLQKLGAVYTDRLQDVEGAKSAWKRVLALQPGQAKAVRVLRDTYLTLGDFDGLTELYTSSRDFEGLAEVLSTAADRATDPTLKIDLSYRAADVYAQSLRAPERAFRAYERVLAVKPSDERAAAALVPLYESEEKWARLPSLYEVLLGHAKDDEQRLAWLQRLADVTGRHLGDRAAALTYARKAFEIAAALGKPDAVDRLEHAAKEAGAWGELTAALEERIAKKETGEAETRALRKRIAAVNAREGQVDDAVSAYRALVEADEKDEEAVVALDRLLREADKKDDLRWLFERRVARADEKHQLELLTEWASLEEDVFQSPEHAVTIYQRILAIVPKHGVALRALARLLDAAGDLEGAVKALETDRDQRAGAERAAHEIEIAQKYSRMRRPTDGLAAARRALDLLPGDPRAVKVVEELATQGEARAAAAAILEECYAHAGQTQKLADILEVRIATAAAKGDRIAFFGRLADVHEKTGELGAAFDAMARAAHEFPIELSLWDRLAVLSQKTKRAAQFVGTITEIVPPEGDTGLPPAVEIDLAERAATLYEEMFGDVDRARPYLERILARDATNERAFQRLKQILTSRERWGELEELYERAVTAATDPVRKADLLAEVALVTEEITGEKAKATAFYERILQIDPDHEQAMRALESLYAAQEQWANLAGLLEKRVPNASGGDLSTLKLRLGTLYFTKLSEPKRALDDLEEVLLADPKTSDARDLVEKCLDVKELRQRAAGVLERLYVERDEPRDLVRVLEVRLEAEMDVSERRELLRRVAELRDERLSDDAGALEAFARFVPLAPGDEDARARMLQIAQRLAAYQRAATVLENAAEAAEAPQPKADVLATAAAIYAQQLRDNAKAEAAYKRVFALAPEDATIALPAARELAKIYVAAERNADLVGVLKSEVKLEDNVETKREILAKIGDLSENVLADPAGAIEAWKQRLEEDPADDRGLVALDRLYERTGEWRALVEILRARERGASDDGTSPVTGGGLQKTEVRKALLLRAATVLADKLSDTDEAIATYTAIVDEFGAEKSTLASLERLYEGAGKSADLADTLEAHLALAEEPDEKVALLARLGHVRKEKTSDTPGAIEAYRQALALRPAHEASRAALEAMLVDTDARREVAGILRPLYEAEGAHANLLRVLDIEAEYTESLGEKLAIYEQALRAAEGPLADTARAWGYAERGLKESAGDSAVTAWIAHAERVAEKRGDYAALAAVLKDAQPNVLDADVALEMTLKVADLGRTRLGDAGLARQYYLKALEQKADERRALVALEALFEEANNAPALLDILKKRVDAAANDEERKALLYKEARLCDDTLKDASAAIDVYETILDLSLDADAIAALERLYATAERWGDLLALHQRELAVTTKDERKAELRYLIGRVHETRLSEIDDAFVQYEEALKIDPQHAPTVGALERLMGERAHAARSAAMLEAVYTRRSDGRAVMRTLEARLAVSEDPDERRTLLRRLAKSHEEQGEDYRAALETIAKLLAEDVTDEATWAELERLARVANAEPRLAEIYATELAKVTSDEPATAKLSRRTGELYESQKDVDKALVFYRRAHAFAPEAKDGTFEAIDRLLRESGRAAERVAHYKKALEWRDDPKDKLTTLHTIALLEEAELHDDDAAIDTYRAAIDVDETDAHSLEALSRLFARRERWRDLADLMRKRAESTAAPGEEAKYRLALGELLDKRLEDKAGSIDEYQAATEHAPPPSEIGKTAVAALEALLARGEHKPRLVEILRPIYERLGAWEKTISLNQERLALIEHPADKVGILRETAKLWEERGGDRARAFAAVRDAFVLDPDDGETRAEVDRLAEATSQWEALAAAYEEGIAKIEGVGQRELLAALARLHDKRRDDPRRALEAWDRLHRLDETDIAPLEEMDALAQILSDWPTLVRVLAKKADLLGSDEERASAWRRVGEARRDMLDDQQGAVEAYERALEIEPDSAFTLDNLIPLYEAKDDAARLVDLYRRRVELCTEDDAELKYRLLVDAAARYELGLGDRMAAIAHLNEALATRPNDAVALARLDTLYGKEKMFAELLENLKLQAAIATDEASKRVLKKRIGALLASELGDPAAALESYREVLAIAYDDEAAQAIRTIGETREELRSEAASALEPVLRTAEKWAALADVLEMRLRAQTEPADRATTLRAIAEVAESKLGDAMRALEALLRTLAEDPGDAALHAWIERLAEGAGKVGWAKYAHAISERAPSVFDAAVGTDLYVRLARIAEEKLGEDARATRAYVQAAELSGDTSATLTALDRLYVKMNEPKPLAEVLERRIGLEADPRAQSDLLHRLAEIQIREFSDETRGLATLRQALERDATHAASRASVTALLARDALFDDAFDALELAYRHAGEGEELAKLYERKVGRAVTPRERSRARLELSRVIEENVKDAARAQRVVEEALAEDLGDADALGELERLAPLSVDGWKRAADALASALRDAKDLPIGTRGELWCHTAVWRRDRLNDAGGAEAAYMHALTADPENVDVVRAIESLQRVPGRERDLVATLRGRAKLEGDPEAKRMLYREAKALAEGPVSDSQLAEQVLRDLLREDEADRWALEELTRLRQAAGDSKEVVALLLRRAEIASKAEAIELQHRAAKAMLEKLGDAPRAIELYETILEDEPSDRLASSSLRTLYAGAGRDKDLARLLELLIDTAETPAERSQARLELAKLQEEKLGAARDAADTLRAILDEDPAHADAIAALSSLFERTSQDEELAELLSTQASRARDRGEVAAEIGHLVRLADVEETKLKDATRALATYDTILERDSVHRGALEAVARLAEARGAWDRASSALAKLVGLSSDGAGVGVALRLAASREKQGDAAGVEEAVRHALALEPANSDVRSRLRALYERERKWEDLAALLVGDADLIHAAHPNAAAEAVAAQAAVVPARSSMPAVATLPPPPNVGPLAEQVKLLRRAAEIHVKERRAPADAIAILERAAALTPTDRDLMMLLCDAYSAAGRQREAAGVLEKIIASFGNKRTKELALYHHRLGRALASLGDKDVALSQLDMAFKIDPGSVQVLKDLGVLALETNDLDRAQKTFRALLLQKLDANVGMSKGEVFFHLGEISARMGDKAKAVQMLERAIENEPTLDRARAMLTELKN